MKIEAPVTGFLGSLLLQKANRPDLISNGFEIDDDLFQAHLARTTAAHPTRTLAENEAIAAYHTLFDRNAPHNIAKGIEASATAAGLDTHQVLFNAQRRSEQATRDLIDHGLSLVQEALQGHADAHRDATLEALSQMTGSAKDAAIRHEAQAEELRHAIGEAWSLLSSFKTQAAVFAEHQVDQLAAGVSHQKDAHQEITALLKALDGKGSDRHADTASRVMAAAARIVQQVGDAGEVVTRSVESLRPFLAETARKTDSLLSATVQAIAENRSAIAQRWGVIGLLGAIVIELGWGLLR